MRLYVGNVPWAATEEELQELFSEYGTCSVRIIRDKETKKSRGFAFVQYEGEDGEKAIEGLHDVVFQGRNLVVNEARERESRSNGNSSESRNGHTDRHTKRERSRGGRGDNRRERQERRERKGM